MKVYIKNKQEPKIIEISKLKKHDQLQTGTSN